MDKKFAKEVVERGREINQTFEDMCQLLSMTTGLLYEKYEAPHLFEAYRFILCGQPVWIDVTWRQFTVWSTDPDKGQINIFKSSLSVEMILALDQVLPIAMTKFFNKNGIAEEDLYETYLANIEK